MKIQFLQPIPTLRAYITKIWLTENPAGLVHHGTLIAPNARAKIIISYKGTLTTTDHKKIAYCPEGDVFFIGIRDVPVTLGSLPGPTGSIGLELTTEGAYKFLKMPMCDLANDLFSVKDLYGREGIALVNKINDEENPLEKVALLQQFLQKQLESLNALNFLLDFSVQMISSTHGLTSIKQLEQKTGYSKRYLDMIFKNHLGISPKTFATIQRFQHFYKQDTITNLDIYDLYYDRSHFIKEFKRYTGYTPIQYLSFNNDFGKNF